jgi:hypothetical protein
MKPRHFLYFIRITNFLILMIIGLGMLTPACSASLSVAQLKKQVTSLLETKDNGSGVTEFAAVHIYGFQETGAEVTVYTWCLRKSFAFNEDQVVDWCGSSVPLAVYLKKERSGVRLLQIKEAKDGSLYGASIQAIFPAKYRREISRGLPPELNGEIKERVLRAAHQYYTTSKARLIKKVPPGDSRDPHQHREEIYGLLNLDKAYRDIMVVFDSDAVIKDGDEKTVSPDGKYTAWIGFKQGFQVFFKDNRGLVDELVFTHHIRPFAGNMAWKGKHILVFDQINGLNTFGDGEDHGVHLEFDCEKKELIWAVPFGTLAGPEKLAGNSKTK